MPRRKGWDELKPDSQARYLRAGIGKKEYEEGAQLQPGRKLTDAQRDAQALKRRRHTYGRGYGV